MFGLTYLGLLHTALSIVAIVAGLMAFAKDGRIRFDNSIGRTYLVSTLIVAITALMIFTRGSFGPGHTAAVITLAGLVVGTLAYTTTIFGKLSPYLGTGGYTIGFLFHLIAGTTETLVRVPPDAPLVTSFESPLLQKIFLVYGVLFLLGLGWQWFSIYRGNKTP